jgi:hypothetical protein
MRGLKNLVLKMSTICGQLKLWRVIGPCLLLAYAIYIGASFAPVAAGADSGGYLNSAKHFLEGRLDTALRMIPEHDAKTVWEYLPLGYVEGSEPGRINPSYPLGLPLHYAVSAGMAGWYWGPLIIGVLAAVGAVAACYACAREVGIDPVLSLAGAVGLAVSPVLLHSSSVPLSDTVSTAWMTGGVWAAMRSRHSTLTRWPVMTGLFFSISVLVRPTSLILGVVPLLLLRPWRGR